MDLAFWQQQKTLQIYTLIESQKQTSDSTFETTSKWLENGQVTVRQKKHWKRNSKALNVNCAQIKSSSNDDNYIEIITLKMQQF